MKNILLILSCICINYTNAQTIIDFDDYANDLDVQSYYMKDVNNYLNQFEGTWKYVNGNNEITLVFKKKTFTYNPNPNLTVMQDELVGEYRYVKNGVEIINTLQNINTNHSSSGDYNIQSSLRSKNNNGGTVPCYMCTVPRQRLYAYYYEPTLDNDGIYGGLLIHTFVENGQTKLFFSIRKREWGMLYYKKSDSTQFATDFDLDLANGEYIFIKIP